MLRFAVERLISALLTAFIVASIVFLVIRLIPGDPVAAMVSPEAGPEERARVRTYLGLNDPLPTQYARFLTRLALFDLGTSIRTGRPVTDELFVRFPATLELTVVALFLIIAISIPLGSLAAARRDSPFDHSARIATLVGVGIPVFWSGLLLAWLFAFQLRLLPVGGRLSVFMEVEPITHFVIPDAILQGQWGAAIDAARHLVLPAVVLAIPPLAFTTRLMRGSLLEVLGEDYIRTGRAKGLSEKRLVVSHALKNALGPIVTVLGLQLVTLLSGAILIENVFAWPGVGSYIFNAIQQRDYPVVQGAVLMIALLYVAINTAVDLAYGVLDPRVRLASVKAVS